jgi:hypothetical protein
MIEKQWSNILKLQTVAQVRLVARLWRKVRELGSVEVNPNLSPAIRPSLLRSPLGFFGVSEKTSRTVVFLLELQQISPSEKYEGQFLRAFL